jgi:hypothetical protein
LSVAAETGTSPIDDFVLGFVMIQPLPAFLPLVVTDAGEGERVTDLHQHVVGVDAAVPLMRLAQLTTRRVRRDSTSRRLPLTRTSVLRRAVKTSALLFALRRKLFKELTYHESVHHRSLWQQR